jgi:hypothetical protein
MANFISLPITSATAHVAGQRLVGVNFVASILATAATTVVIYALNKTITLTTSAAGALPTINAINAAIMAMPGANVVEVDLPAGVTITAISVA